jgi:hypothetical protein
MPSFSSFLKTLIIVLPIALGVGLTGLGVFRLVQASEKPVSRPLSPYGILAFCSEKCDSFDLSMNLFGFDLKGNSVRAFCIIRFGLSPSVVNDSSFEVVFGLQMPYQVEVQQDIEQGKRVNVYAGNNELEVLETETLFSQVNRTSIFYLKFVTEPENRDYHVTLTFDWKDLVNRQSFALYEMVVPFCSSMFNIAVQYFPDVYPLNYTALNLSIELPDDCEIRDTIPLPDKEELISMSNPEKPEVLEPHRYLSWQFPPNRVLEGGEQWPTSDIVRVRFELMGESELQNRLLFDSGLYLGLGIGLLISGLHEALKYVMETRKVTKTSP